MSVKVTCDFDFETDVKDATYRAIGNAAADYSYSPGCMYRRNGDPGDPPEEELDITDVDITSLTYYTDEGDEVELNEIPDEVKDKVYDVLNDHWEWFIKEGD